MYYEYVCCRIFKYITYSKYWNVVKSPIYIIVYCQLYNTLDMYGRRPLDDVY